MSKCRASTSQNVFDRKQHTLVVMNSSSRLARPIFMPSARATPTSFSFLQSAAQNIIQGDHFQFMCHVCHKQRHWSTIRIATTEQCIITMGKASSRKSTAHIIYIVKNAEDYWEEEIPAQSKWRQPSFKASKIALWMTPGSARQTPKPSTGILCPLLSVIVFCSISPSNIPEKREIQTKKRTPTIQ